MSTITYLMTSISPFNQEPKKAAHFATVTHPCLHTLLSDTNKPVQANQFQGGAMEGRRNGYKDSNKGMHFLGHKTLTQPNISEMHGTRTILAPYMHTIDLLNQFNLHTCIANSQIPVPTYQVHRLTALHIHKRVSYCLLQSNIRH